MAADAEATLPALIEACKRLITADRRTTIPGARQSSGRRARGRAQPRPHRGDVRVERLSDQYGPVDRRVVGADQERGLGPGLGKRQQQRLGDAAVELRQALPVPRRLGRRWRRLRRSRSGRRRAREQEARTAVGQYSGRRRLPVCTGCLVDGGPSPHSAPLGHAQQPGLPPGSHAHSAHGQSPQSRRDEGHSRHDDRQSERRLRENRRRVWASTRRGRSRTPPSSGRPSNVRWTSSNAASRRSSTSSRSRARGAGDEALCTSSRLS